MYESALNAANLIIKCKTHRKLKLHITGYSAVVGNDGGDASILT
jgi:hypothetical protein